MDHMIPVGFIYLLLITIVCRL